MPITMSEEAYEALVSLARRGASDPLAVDAFVRDIDKANGVSRYFLKLRWQVVGLPLPPGSNFPEVWPARQEMPLAMNRPIAKSDVLDAIASVTPSAVSILVTSDPAGLVGWTELEVYFAR